jgi:hypothetical protein
MSTNISIGLWLPTQAALLVLFYGGFIPTLPWWVVWLPSICLIAWIVIALIIMVGVLILAAL